MEVWSKCLGFRALYLLFARIINTLIELSDPYLQFANFSILPYVHLWQNSSKGICQNLQILLGGFETKTGEQVCDYINYQLFNI